VRDGAGLAMGERTLESASRSQWERLSHINREHWWYSCQYRGYRTVEKKDMVIF
jgi:hypothetical protein